MSMRTMGQSQQRVGYAAGGSGGTDIPATLWTNSGSGSRLYAAGLHLPATGSEAMTEADITAKKLALWINGVEHPIYTEASRSRHPNGNVASVNYAATFDPASVSTIKWVVGVARTTTDTSRPSSGWDATIFAARNHILPSDASYRVRTNMTGEPLVVRTSFNATEAALLTTKFNEKITLAAGIAGQAAYFTARRLFSAYACETTDATAKTYLGLALDVIAYSKDLFWDGAVYTPTFTEPPSTVWWDYGIAYEITGYGVMWGIVNSAAEQFCKNADVQTGGSVSSTAREAGGFMRASADSNIRFNLMYLGWWMVAYRLQATFRGTRQEDFTDNIPNVLTCFDYYAWDSTSGAYRNGLRAGLAMGQNAQGSSGNVFPNFQVSVANGVLRDWKYNIYDDSRIAGWIRTNVEVVLGNVFLIDPANYYSYGGTQSKWICEYASTATRVTSDDGTTDPFDFMMHAPDFAFAAAAYPSDTVYSDTLATWRDRALSTLNQEGLSYSAKFSGETFCAWAAPYYRIMGIPSGPSVLREPTVYAGNPS